MLCGQTKVKDLGTKLQNDGGVGDPQGSSEMRHFIGRYT